MPLIVGGALFMQTLDATIVTTALPVMGRSLHVNPVRLNIVITAYLTSLAVFIPLSGWLADRFGARRIFRASIAVFTLGSVMCGFSRTLARLVAARLMQGFGGAMISPVGRLLVLRAVRKEDWVEAISYLTVPAMLGPVVGPALGGFIVTFHSWRWIFFINVPVCVAGLALVTLLIRDEGESLQHQLDLPGFALCALGLVCLEIGLELAGRGIFPASVVVAILIAGVGSLVLYAPYALGATHPIIDPKLFRIATFRITIIGGSLFRMGLETMPFLLAILFQVGFGLSPFTSGVLTFFSAATAISMKVTASPIVSRVGFRPLLVTNCIASSAFMMSCVFFRPSTPYLLIVGVLLVGGFLRSLQFTSMAALSYADVPSDLISESSSLAGMTHQLSTSVGITLAALILHLRLGDRGGQVLSVIEIAPAFIVLATIALLGNVFFWRLPRDAGAALRKRRENDGSLASTIRPKPVV